MPYPNVPASLTDKMDKCVLTVSGEPRMKEKYPDAKERKSHAIAICHASIVGKTKIEDSINDLLKIRKGVNNMKEDVLEDFAKVYENEGMEAFSDADLFKLAPAGSDDIAKAKFSACMREQVKTGKNFKEAAKACQMPAKDEHEDGKEEETKAKKVDGDSEDVKVEESETEEAKVEKAKKAKKAKKDPKEDDEEAEAKEEKDEEAEEKDEEAKDKKESKKVDGAEAPSIKGVLEKAMGSKDVEQMRVALQEVDDAKAMVEEAISKLEGGKDVNPALAKLDSVLEKVDGIAKSVSSLEERLAKVEETPVDSKVSSTAVVVKRNEDAKENPRVTEIDEELKKLEHVKDYDLQKFQGEKMWEKAFNLIAERDQLLAK